MTLSWLTKPPLTLMSRSGSSFEPDESFSPSTLEWVFRSSQDQAVPGELSRAAQMQPSNANQISFLHLAAAAPLITAASKACSAQP